MGGSAAGEPAGHQRGGGPPAVGPSVETRVPVVSSRPPRRAGHAQAVSHPGRGPWLQGAGLSHPDCPVPSDSPLIPVLPPGASHPRGTQGTWTSPQEPGVWAAWLGGGGGVHRHLGQAHPNLHRCSPGSYGGTPLNSITTANGFRNRVVGAWKYDRDLSKFYSSSTQHAK